MEAGGQPRLSLTLRYVQEDEAARRVSERDGGVWERGERCLAQWLDGRGDKGHMHAGRVTDVDARRLTCAVAYDDGDRDASVSWRVMCRPEGKVQQRGVASRTVWERGQKRKR